MFDRNILPSVCLRLIKYALSYIMQYMRQCVFSLPINVMMMVRICVHHHQTGRKNDSSLFGLDHRKMACAVCLPLLLNMKMSWQGYYLAVELYRLT